MQVSDSKFKDFVFWLQLHRHINTNTHLYIPLIISGELRKVIKKLKLLMTTTQKDLTHRFQIWKRTLPVSLYKIKCLGFVSIYCGYSMMTIIIQLSLYMHVLIIKGHDAHRTTGI